MSNSSWRLGRPIGTAGRKAPTSTSWKTAVIATICVLLMAGCSGGGSGADTGGSGEPDTEATLTYGLAAAPNTLDPHMAQSMRITMTFGLWGVYDRLFSVDSSGKPVGQLVTSYDYSEDGLAIILKLRDDVAFRDGVALDAEVVALNLERARTLESPVVKTRMADVSKTEATAPHEVTVRLKSPTPDVPAILAEAAGFIMHPDLIKNGDPATETNGSGPYVMKSFVPGESMTISRDGAYWDKDAAKIKTIKYENYGDPQAYINAMQGGQIDLAYYQPGETKALESNSDIELVKVDQGFSTQLALNRNVAPLDDVRVRQAINYAIDRVSITDSLYNGSKPKWQDFREGLTGFNSSLEAKYKYDAAKAKQLLADAGYPNGVDMGPILINPQISKGLTDVVLEQLTSAGIRTKFLPVDGVQLLSRYAEGKNVGGIFSFVDGMSAGTAVANRWLAKTNNPAGTTPEFEALRAKATNRVSAKELDQAYQDLAAYVVEEAWSAPISSLRTEWAFDKKVHGVSEDMDYAKVLGPVDLRYVWVEK